MTLKDTIESVLFIAGRPLTAAKLANLLELDKQQIIDALQALEDDYRTRNGGVAFLRHGDEVQLVTPVEAAPVVQKFLKDETTGELTKPALETLTIIAYRGPITKSDLEKVRGVNCTLILRNLMMRGLVTAEDDKKRLVTYYQLSVDCLRFLGLTRVEELPSYESLRSAEVVERLLAEGGESV